jgi:hypothetical protein
LTASIFIEIVVEVVDTNIYCRLKLRLLYFHLNFTMTLNDKDRSPPAGQYHVIRHKDRLLDEDALIQRLFAIRMPVTGQSRALPAAHFAADTAKICSFLSFYYVIYFQPATTFGAGKR